MIIEEKRRELFEAWCIENHGTMGMPSYPEWCLEKNLNGKYSSLVIQGAWDGFNAALDAVVIELPGRKYSANDDRGIKFIDHDYDCEDGFNLGVEDCRAAIESTGIGLKVKP